jgi:two-component system chemotaxis response regulator CheB
VAHRDLVVIGASAGGVEALRTLAASLPADFPAAIAIVLHVSPYGGSALPAILSRAGQLPARHAQHGEPMKPGELYVAPPDFHLLVHDEHFALSRGPRENGHRPAADALFRTAARGLGSRVVGVVLSGAMDDGTAGLAVVRERGGVTVVQDPADAMYPAMPASAMASMPVDHVVTIAELADLLVRRCTEEVQATAPAPAHRPARAAEVAGVDEEPAADPPSESRGRFSCPDCNGVLDDVHEGEVVRYRCQVGHAWSAESLLAQQSLALESALWMAVRSLEEKAQLCRQLAERADERGNTMSADRFRSGAAELGHAATLLREMLESGAGFAPTGPQVG